MDFSGILITGDLFYPVSGGIFVTEKGFRGFQGDLPEFPVPAAVPPFQEHGIVQQRTVLTGMVVIEKLPHTGRIDVNEFYLAVTAA